MHNNRADFFIFLFSIIILLGVFFYVYFAKDRHRPPNLQRQVMIERGLLNPTTSPAVIDDSAAVIPRKESVGPSVPPPAN